MAKRMTPYNLQKANERRRKHDRNIRIMEMWKGGAGPSQISRALEAQGEKLSVPRISNIVHAELRRAREQREHLGLELFDGELERLSTIIRQAWGVMMAPCPECNGEGKVEGIAEVAATKLVCKTCAGGGKLHDASTRIKAMKEVRNAVDQRAKMLGMYAPEKFAFTDTAGRDRAVFREELESMNIDDLDKALADFRAGAELARPSD